MSKSFWKNPFLFFGLVIIILAVTALSFSLLWQKSGSGSFSFKRDIFDNSQYLFPDQGRIVADIELSIAESAVLLPLAPAFLIEGKVLGAAGIEGVIEAGQSGQKEIIKYVVEKGDTLSSIADQFGISLETLFWANNLGERSVLKVGQELSILPVSGVLHIVRQNETISEIAQVYQAKASDIVDFNELGQEATIYAGDILVVPGGKEPKVAVQYQQVPLSQSYFICPIPSPCRITQGLHWYNAIDFSNAKCGEPVFAAAGGVVQRIGYTALGGNYVRILHPNDVITYYGHLSKTAVSPGEKVYQGQIVGYIGYSGVTVPAGPSGCHLHFDVRFAENPFAKFSVGDQLGK